jgi:hypothetical protein
MMRPVLSRVVESPDDPSDFNHLPNMGNSLSNRHCTRTRMADVPTA